MILLCQNSVAGTGKKVQVGWHEIKIPAGARDFALFHNVPTDSMAHPDVYLAGTMGSYTSDKAAVVRKWKLTST